MAHAVTRWTPKRKASLVSQILNDEISPQQACDVHGMTPEELAAWVFAHERGGPMNLRDIRDAARKVAA